MLTAMVRLGRKHEPVVAYAIWRNIKEEFGRERLARANVIAALGSLVRKELVSSVRKRVELPWRNDILETDVYDLARGGDGRPNANARAALDHARLIEEGERKMERIRRGLAEGIRRLAGGRAPKASR